MRCEIDHTIPVPELRLFHSRGRMTTWCAKRGIPNECMEFLDADAQAWTWKKDSEVVCIVLFENMADDLSDAALLAHEAVHVACNTLGMIGEDDYGEETLAYLVEAFTLALLRAHRKWMDKHPELRQKGGAA